MADKPAETIQTLLEAEQMAKTLVEQARKERDVRLKTAASEADAEIAQYRAAKEDEYQAQVKKYVGSTGETSDKIAATAQKNIKSTVAAAKSNKASVVDMLVSYVREV
ncbi:V-type ATP synthase, Subunit G [Chondrus crispus]|uniref:V-type proton ATPase subunit G n=1 Tax=Chondrus crispus TaxID=2769 RepID=R7QDH3_CHOCR|nr:V-type ATP synthase, Subunit G [Chondrus crispus]CDF36134.1 V-type ATP synthase, Subunit G [Chondrus crispus]|eukprot:XP_005715953.1 V-type ATP synthase, Subunit G [Chondrus crispus]